MSTKTLHTGIAVTVTLIVVGIFFILGMPFSTSSLDPQSQLSNSSATQGQVLMQDLVVGQGPAAQQGDLISVNYTGKLEDGTVFDTSVGRAPYAFVLGSGTVIPGWDQGLIGAQAGTRRILVVPAGLGYGSSAYGPIPANSTLVFDIEVVSVTPATPVQ